MSDARAAITGRLTALRPQDRRALTIGAILLLVMLGYAKIVRPALAELFSQRALLAEQQSNLARERALVASMERLPRIRDTITRQLSAESPRLFSGDSVSAMADLTSYATDIARVALVRLTSVEAHAPKSAQGVTTLAVDLRGEGTWRGTLSFVRALESATKLVDVQTLRIERGPRGGPLGGDLVTFSATIAGYSRSAP